MTLESSRVQTHLSMGMACSVLEAFCCRCLGVHNGQSKAARPCSRHGGQQCHLVNAWLQTF